MLDPPLVPNTLSKPAAGPHAWMYSNKVCTCQSLTRMKLGPVGIPNHDAIQIQHGLDTSCKKIPGAITKEE